jgi:ABC-type glycerol-3-phosphate transport system substrate-binding protein
VERRLDQEFQNNGFATQLCPGWMLGVISGNAAGVTGWDIADTFPGGGGNWGGSYLTVPNQSKHQAEAKKLAAWLTAPEQQLKAFASKGTFRARSTLSRVTSSSDRRTRSSTTRRPARSWPTVPRPSM